jgi:murein DD-endopeptidase MepM/ murein hydrolase activator NlpD
MVNGRRINPETILDVDAHALHRQIVTFKRVGKGIDVSTTRKERKKQEEMSMDTNNPFGDKAVYRLDLNDVRSWHYPLEDSHVISGYGGRRHHSGVDIKNAPNMNVYAAFDGLVVQSGVFAGYGKCITVRHHNGLETRYSHNSKNFVNVGDKVKAGDVIGTTGRTGRATTEHLHFETRIAGRAFDPAYVFDHVNHCLLKCVLQFKKNGGVARLK